MTKREREKHERNSAKQTCNFVLKYVGGNVLHSHFGVVDLSMFKWSGK